VPTDVEYACAQCEERRSEGEYDECVGDEAPSWLEAVARDEIE
jgi:hypothetical protein